VVGSPAEDGRNSSGVTPTKDIFEDPAIAAAAQNDPFSRFVVEHWKRIAGALVAVALGIIAFNAVSTTREQKRAAATALFGQVRDQYQEIIKKKGELTELKSSLAGKSDADKKSVEEKITAADSELNSLRDKAKLMVASLDSPPPFDILGRLYGGLIASQFGDFEVTRAALIATSWERVGSNGSAERMAAELAALGLAKGLSESPTHLGTAKDALTTLAEKGEFSAVPAAQALAALAATAEDKEKVRKLLSTLEGRFPSQSKFITEAREGL
jgi:hypothetical protein